MCLTGTVVASWSQTLEVAGLNPFTVRTNIFFTEDPLPNCMLAGFPLGLENLENLEK